MPTEVLLRPATADDASAVAEVLLSSRKAFLPYACQLYVSPAHVAQGVGTLLLSHALANLPLPVRLWCFQRNVRARRFYERHGFNAIRFTDGRANEERLPDILYERAS